MFENLSSREKKLAIGVLLLVPTALLFMGVFWFLDKQGDYTKQLGELDRSIKLEKQKRDRGSEANTRKFFYTNLSAPPKSTNAYLTWLNTMTVDVFGDDAGGAKPVSSLKLKYDRNKVLGTRQTYSVKTKCDLPTLHKFFDKFYSVDLLHRINTVSINPIEEGTGKKAKLTGRLTIKMEIEVLSLNDAEPRANFTAQTKPVGWDQEKIDYFLKRDIFGPPNEAPKWNSVSGPRLTVGNEARVVLTATDANQDKLKLEMIESPIEGAKFEINDPNSPKARLVVPSQEPGTYTFKFRVTDDGLPPMSVVKTLAVNYTAKAKPKPPTKVAVKKDPPKFKNATRTRVTAITKGIDGHWRAWVTVDTIEDGKYRLKLNDTFQMDDMEWTLTKLEPRMATFTAGGKTYVARKNLVQRGRLEELKD